MRSVQDMVRSRPLLASQKYRGRIPLPALRDRQDHLHTGRVSSRSLNERRVEPSQAVRSYNGVTSVGQHSPRCLVRVHYSLRSVDTLKTPSQPRIGIYCLGLMWWLSYLSNLFKVVMFVDTHS